MQNIIFMHMESFVVCQATDYVVCCTNESLHMVFAIFVSGPCGDSIPVFKPVYTSTHVKSIWYVLKHSPIILLGNGSREFYHNPWKKSALRSKKDPNKARKSSVALLNAMPALCIQLHDRLTDQLDGGNIWACRTTWRRRGLHFLDSIL